MAGCSKLIRNHELLLARLYELPEGPLPKEIEDEAVQFIGQYWDEFTGGTEPEKMSPEKLDRVEQVRLEKPAVILFEIERHGSFCCGSVYAEVQTWFFNLKNYTFGHSLSGRKLLGKRDKPLNTKAVAEAVAKEILRNNRGSRFLRWKTDSDVIIQIGAVVPKTNKQTTSTRRRRFNRDLHAILHNTGWVSLRANRWHRLEVRVGDK